MFLKLGVFFIVLGIIKLFIALVLKANEKRDKA